MCVCVTTAEPTRTQPPSLPLSLSLPPGQPSVPPHAVAHPHQSMPFSTRMSCSVELRPTCDQQHNRAKKHPSEEPQYTNVPSEEPMALALLLGRPGRSLSSSSSSSRACATSTKSRTRWLMKSLPGHVWVWVPVKVEEDDVAPAEVVVVAAVAGGA